MFQSSMRNLLSQAPQSLRGVIQRTANELQKAGKPKHLAYHPNVWVPAARMAFCQNANIPTDFWKEIQGELVTAARDRLNVVEMFRENDLVETGGDMGTTVSTWADIPDLGDAVQAMDFDVEAAQQQQFPSNSNIVPLPVTYQVFPTSVRMQGGTIGDEDFTYESSLGQASAVSVAEKLEDTALNGTDVTITVDSTQSSGPGIESWGSRLTGNLNAVWTDVTSRNIVGDNDSDINSMLQDASDQNFNGPFAVLVPGNYDHVLDEDYDTSGGSLMTIRDRIERMNKVEEVRVVDRMSDDVVALVQLEMIRNDWRQIQPDGGDQPVTTVNWGLNPMRTQFLVFSIAAPRLKPDPESGNGAIVTYS